MGDEAGGLHRVHQQLELGEFEGAGPHIIHHLPAFLALDDVQAEVGQRLQIGIHAFAFGGDALLLQQGDKLRHRQTVILIGALQQDALQKKGFHLLIGGFGHTAASL